MRRLHQLPLPTRPNRLCGIAGFLPTGRDAAEILADMCNAIAHRGPDDDGSYIDPKVALGMKRLSIIGVADGRQPIWNENHSAAVIFNGEIYNYRELQKELKGRGHQFRTHTDTECLIHLYEDFGARLVNHLHGMFAFAIWDAEHDSLLLARDRVGKKPLYYYEKNGTFVFASELKALWEHPSVVRTVSPSAIHDYLTLQYVPAPKSIIEGVRRLPPAHTLLYRNGVLDIQRYWELSYTPKLKESHEELRSRLWAVLSNATKVRLVAERPIGAFLSGGIDSSLVVAAMSDHVSDLRTFSMAFEDPAFDERRFARAVANHYSTSHTELEVSERDALEVVPTIPRHYDEPFADSSALPSLLLSKLAVSDVTVALNGDGGDECFAGYGRYPAFVRALQVAEAQPSRLLAPLVALCRHPLAQTLLTKSARLTRLATLTGRFAAARQEPAKLYAEFISYFRNEQKDSLYTQSFAHTVAGLDTYDIIRREFARLDHEHVVDQLLGTDVATYLPNDLLVKMDIATMAHSLEVRSPFLDHNLMEFAARLPVELKLHRGIGKCLLRDIALERLPREVVERPKMGFGVPLASWLRGPLKELAWDTLTDSTANARGYFVPGAVVDLLRAHQAGEDHSPRLWALLQLELWHRTYANRAPVP